MKRTIRVITLLSIIFIISEITFISNAIAKDFFIKQKKEDVIIVDINGNADFNNINEAIEYAQSNSTIYIRKGEYKEIIDIKKKIYLKGEDMSKTIINPISEKNKYAIRLGASGVKIQNLSIINDAPGLYSSGIRITSPNTEISFCNIYETPIGIAIWASKNTIKNCNIWGCNDEAIALIGSPYSDCNDNNIFNCKLYNNCDGIELQYSSNNIIKNCEIYDNTHTGIDAISSSNNNNIISNCKIYNNDVNGIYISSSSENKILDCNIFNNCDENIVINGKSENNHIETISNNDIKEKKENYVNRIYDFLNNFHNPIIEKIFSIIETLSYLKEKYKF
jgi:parallel beta-helix repeat protein